MRFRNAFKILTVNFSLVYKQLLYRIIVGVVFFSLTYVVLRLGMDVIMKSAEMDALKSHALDFVRTLFGGDSARLEVVQGELQEAVKALVTLIGEHIGTLVGSIIGVCMLYLLSRFAGGLCVFALAHILNDRMSEFARTRFPAAFFKSTGRAALYQVIYVPLVFIYDLLSLVACWFFFFYAPSFLPDWGIMKVLVAIALAVTAFIFLEALKMTFISAWMPSMVAGGMRTGEAMRFSFRARKNFWRRFSGFLVSVYFILAINVCAVFFTFGSGLLLTIPASFLLLLCLQFVNYYEDNNKKYYISFSKIEGGDDIPETLGE